uniref:PiggyBac transposable element-derived protein domain-containing protein n=1 Tax=Clastoptera arizonana TaxID=38151 RepID=A0A1B6CKB4_9HEMI
MKSKPAKYGIKIFSMACARTFYISKMEVYVGKQPDGPFSVDNSGMSVIERLVEPITGTYQNISVDNWICSIPLCEKLLVDYQFTLVGTLRKNKREIPPLFLEKK